ncbi:MAG: phosphonate C-P lyase system protein PhnG [Hyphomicrobiales bacterium]|nr:phosphonate C-P lyase system protein PhnG [Hyphomicrobiales bacterium]
MRIESETETAGRRRVMAVLARSERVDIDKQIGAIEALPRGRNVRPVQIGLVMLRGRIAGIGAPFNLGEATVTRAVVRLPTGETGFSYVFGRDEEKANRAALVDALWQCPKWRATVESEIIAPLAQMLRRKDAVAAAETAATRVDFFTLVRGED